MMTAPVLERSLERVVRSIKERNALERTIKDLTAELEALRQEAASVEVELQRYTKVLTALDAHEPKT